MSMTPLTDAQLVRVYGKTGEMCAATPMCGHPTYVPADFARSLERMAAERDEHARWRQDLADKLDEVERHRDAIGVALNKCSEERDSAIRERDSAKVDLEEVCDTRDRLVEIVERRRKLLERVLQCGLCEEPHGVGFTPSRQERIASDLARDIGNELRGIDALVKG